jgi:outer membrane receptor protein involved in Fe transport
VLRYAIKQINSMRADMLRTFFASCAAMVLLLVSASAQEESTAVQKDKKIPGISTVVIVTSSKIDEPQENITQKVNVISEDQIEAQATSSRNVAELLQYQPGVSATVLSRNDDNWGSYGGLGPKYSSYLLDGLPIDSFVDTMSLDPWAFERIETHQGPASVLYSNYLSADFAGNQAPLAGISNLVLKDRIEKPGTHMIVDGGSWRSVPRFRGRPALPGWSGVPDGALLRQFWDSGFQAVLGPRPR